MEELQTIVDTLAEELGRSVAIDDPSLNLRSYSAHHGHVDAVRVTSIMTRSVPAEISSWVFKQGIKKATAPVRIPGNPDYELEPRFCVPIRRERELLGFLWLLESEGPIAKREIEAAKTAAESAAEVMYRDRLLDDIRLGRERELVRDLLSPELEVREHAAAALVDADLLTAGPGYHAVVVAAGGGGMADPAIGPLIEAALADTRVHHARRNVISLGRPDYGLLLMSEGDPTLRERGAMGLGSELQAAMQRHLDRGLGGRALVGVGDRRRSLSEINSSYANARYAIRVAEVVSSFAPVAAWSQLGIYQMLIKFPTQDITSEALPPALLRLMERSDSEVLIKTLETYLDRGGNAPATAELLNVHRVSLYARLRRIEEVAGIDLSDGQERLALHLGLKLGRLARLLD